MNDKLTYEEMKKTLDIFVDCYELVHNKLGEPEKVEVAAFVEKVSLMVPCLSLRPDSLQEYNDKIFKSVALTHFMFDLSFKFFSLAGDHSNFIERLIGKLKDGLEIDGLNPRDSIIPKEIASSCPVTLFALSENKISQWIKNNDDRIDLHSFLRSNKHFILLYLMHLTNQ